jgi:preprotein translocase subunit SecG
METFLIIIHFIITILLMIVILLQSSKGGGLAGVFGGGGGMGAVFGGRGAASFLSKVTTVLAALFLGLALLISYIDKGKTIDNSVARERLRQSSPASVLPTVPQEPTASEQSVPSPAATPIDTSR